MIVATGICALLDNANFVVAHPFTGSFVSSEYQNPGCDKEAVDFMQFWSFALAVWALAWSDIGVVGNSRLRNIYSKLAPPLP